MKVNQIEYQRLGNWSHTDMAYLQHDPKLSPFYEYEPVKENFDKVISARKKLPVNRALLLSTLKKQYAALEVTLPISDEVMLSENTFTVTTAHQPVLFTGPLYHLYKIASTINLSLQLKETHPDHNFIPVFVLGAEDHDWAETNHYYLFGKKHQWERTASGSAGRLNLEGLDTLIEEAKEIFKNAPKGNEIYSILQNALQKATTYAQFHQSLLISLFHEFGLVVFNMDEVELKRAFLPILEKELTESISTKYVPATQALLEKSGFKPQAFCRPINLFYMDEGIRERIEPTADGGFIRVDSKISYTKTEIVDELHSHPERFSPNVILRPLYQEFTLPNLAYIGGGGELAYWLERKTQFEAFGVHFPMLIRRNSLLLIDEATTAQIEKAGLQWEDLLDDYDSIVKTYLNRLSGKDLNFEEEEKWLMDAYQSLASKAERVDPTLASAIQAEKSKQAKAFEQLGSRLLRSQKQQQETSLNRIKKLKEKLFPEGGLQERRDNMLSFYADHGQELIRTLISVSNPLEEKFTILSW
jgi:bacillithiol biosynthesis cysteine-adding enzyme BshC